MQELLVNDSCFTLHSFHFFVQVLPLFLFQVYVINDCFVVGEELVVADVKDFYFLLSVHVSEINRGQLQRDPRRIQLSLFICPLNNAETETSVYIILICEDLHCA